jgi:glutamyl-tRNA reductase
LAVTQQVSLATFAYPDLGADKRSAIARSRTRVDPDGSTFIFETCLRTEVMVAGGEDRLLAALDRHFGGIPELAAGRVRFDAEAVEHLYRVASGLESPIRGEGEVLAQFRQAVNRAEDDGMIGGIFSRLIESAVATGRRAREMMPESAHDSLAAVAAQVVGGADRIAVLGSGIMASAVVKALQALPAPPPITVVARNPEHVWLEAVDVWDFQRTGEALKQFPAVVSATSAKRRLVEADEMAAAMAERPAPLILVDMAMPPDFPVDGSYDVVYVGIDDLAKLASRRSQPDHADPVVKAGALEAFRAFRDHHHLGPVIGGLTRYADDVVDGAVARFATRLQSEEDLAIVRQTAHTVARTLIAGPISYVKHPDRAPEALDIVAEAFGVDG